MRKVKFENDKYYHIYNRGVDRRDVFCDEKDFVRFIISMREFNTMNSIGSLYEKTFRDNVHDKGVRHPIGCRTPQLPLVEFVVYCLNKNHYHFIVKQLIEGGISLFMKKIGTGYTNYFNKKYKRSGSLFQGKYKFKYIETEKYLSWLSGYVNGNPEIHSISNAKNYKWSSYQDYLGIRNGSICHKGIILSQFNNIYEYEEFVEQVVADSSDKKDSIKEYLSGLE